MTFLELLGFEESTFVTDGLPSEAWFAAVARCYTVGSIILAASLVVWVTSRLARRAGITAKWPMASTILVAVLAGFIWSDATPKTREKPGMLMVGMGYPLRNHWTIFQASQLVAPLALGIWLSRRGVRTVAQPMELARAA